MLEAAVSLQPVSPVHALDGKLYFEGWNGSEYELYVYDPGTGTTAKVASADLGSGSFGQGTSPNFMLALDGKLYFRGNDGSEDELYVYNPATAATFNVPSCHSVDLAGFEA